ncbi:MULTISPECIES: bifunctional folylpolyglutamate synthase/dihydrofolate synthase [Hyphobacterium]|uniref:Dihydrofolate synthase/folylpolyglutamate synthase n=1 Tax=Hyphobacterium vulgare TaxID=1736751 RepID=A0ABV6ZXW3_9PROT
MTGETTGEVLKRLAGLHPRSIDLSLDRIERLLAALGHPHEKLPPVVHVAGTNGKGSVCAFLKAMCEAAGERVHLYTSPHLVRFNERIELFGQPVDDARLLDALKRVEAANGGQSITFFEATTAAALLLFSETPADRLILEVGLGGRWDATNVIARPELTVITPVSLDHQDYLGDSLGGIAGEKAGILKPGIPAIIGPQEGEALDAIERQAFRLSAPMTLHGRDWRCWSEQGRIVFEEESLVWDLPAPALIGGHQVDNAGIAIAAARALGLGEEEVRAGLSAVRWPARLQHLTRGRLAELVEGGGGELWVDGGHNPAAGEALARAMADLEARRSMPLVLVCGFSASKDAHAYLKHFTDLARWVIAVEFDTGREPSKSVAEVQAAGRAADIMCDTGITLTAAIGRALTITRPAPRILVCGSLYLAGQLLAEIEGVTPERTPG